MPIDVVDLDNPTTKPGSIPLSDLIDSISTINARLTLNRKIRFMWYKSVFIIDLESIL